MLTGDLSAADVKWIVQYRIADPFSYLFRIRDPHETLRDLSQSVMSAVVGDRSVDEVLTVGREEINAEVHRKMQEALDEYETGLRVELVQLQTVDPPDEKVKAALDNVNRAEQEKQRAVNEAMQEYNRKIPQAEGRALRAVQEAEGYRIDRVNRARGETAHFLAVLEEYRKAPEVTRRRLYLETMAELLPELGPKIVIDSEVKSALPLLELGPGPAGGER
jgi:membrane protease subunit HflK